MPSPRAAFNCSTADERENVSDVKQWLRLVGHAIVERRQDLRKKTCGNKGRA